jgi:hypothetical protein
MTGPELVVDGLRAALYGAEPLVARLPQSTLDPIARAAAWIGDDGEMRAELESLFGDRPIPPGVVEEARALAIRNELEVLRYRRLDARTIDRTCVLEGGEHSTGARARAGRHRRDGALRRAPTGDARAGLPRLRDASALGTASGVGRAHARERASALLRRRWAIERTLPVTHVNVFRFLRPRSRHYRTACSVAFDGGGARSGRRCRSSRGG